MFIVGITGPIGHGKTAVGRALQKLESNSVHYESAQVIAKLAEQWLAMAPELPKPDDITAINNWLQKLVPVLNSDFGANCTFLDVKLEPEAIRQQPDRYQKLFDYLSHPDTANTPITEESKELFRPLLQWMGGYFVAKVDFGIWYKKILKQIQADQARGAVLATVGGVRFPQDAAILKEAGGIIVEVVWPGKPLFDQEDPTERQRSTIMVDTTVLNNGNLLDLEACVGQLYADLQAGQLKASYSAI